MIRANPEHLAQSFIERSGHRTRAETHREVSDRYGLHNDTILRLLDQYHRAFPMKGHWG